MTTHKPQNSSSILTIGDEVTCGQISNRNSQWLSQQLTELGYPVQTHLSCNDRIDDICEALTFAASKSQVICLTGGLGPTTDDVTRDAIAKFLGQPLAFHQESWERIESFFAALDATPKPTNKQQCYFPEGSQIFPNGYGTADGFFVEDHNHAIKIFVLPGPPRELHPMWGTSVLPLLHKYSHEDVLHAWRLIGIGESHLQDEVSKLDLPEGARMGYRASIPLLEVKYWHKNSGDQRGFQDFLAKLENLLKPWLYERGDQNYIKTFVVDVLPKFPGLTIDDHVTGGYLHKLVSEAIPEGSTQSLKISTSLSSSPSLLDPPYLALFKDKTSQTQVSICSQIDIEEFSSSIALPFPESRKALNQKAAAWLALKHFSRTMVT